jgi:lipoate-protein ligase B
LDLQLALVDARRTGLCPSDVLLLLEHFPVFTLGRRGGLDNLRVSESFLEKSGIPVIQAERGGNITYHGPGQIVGYPILDLHAAKLSVTAYVENLEEVMIRTAADFGVKAERNPANRGVWVGNNKLGSIGIAVRRGICFHGFALNANPSTEPFGWINPCGLHGVGMTTLERECQQKISVSAVQEALKGHIESVFGVRLNQCNLLLGGCKAREENRYDGFCK